MTPRLRLERPDEIAAAELAALARASRRLHRPWVYPHQQARGWRKYLARCAGCCSRPVSATTFTPPTPVAAS